MIVKYTHLRKYGIDTILKPFVQELKMLEHVSYAHMFTVQGVPPSRKIYFKINIAS